MLEGGHPGLNSGRCTGEEMGLESEAWAHPVLAGVQPGLSSESCTRVEMGFEIEVGVVMDGQNSLSDKPGLAPDPTYPLFGPLAFPTTEAGTRPVTGAVTVAVAGTVEVAVGVILGFKSGKLAEEGGRLRRGVRSVGSVSEMERRRSDTGGAIALANACAWVGCCPGACPCA